MEKRTADHMEVWDLYFATLAGWTLHPGYKRAGTTQIDLMDCARLANQMMEIRQWPDGEPQQQQQHQHGDNGVPTSQTERKPDETESFKSECLTRPSREGWQT